MSQVKMLFDFLTKNKDYIIFGTNVLLMIFCIIVFLVKDPSYAGLYTLVIVSFLSSVVVLFTSIAGATGQY